VSCAWSFGVRSLVRNHSGASRRTSGVELDRPCGPQRALSLARRQSHARRRCGWAG